MVAQRYEKSNLKIASHQNTNSNVHNNFEVYTTIRDVHNNFSEK